MNWYFYVGLIAAICIAAFNAPQLIQVFKTKNTCGMSTGMLLLLLIGDFCFVLNGIGILANKGTDSHSISLSARLSAGLPLLLANLIASIMTVGLLCAKVKSLYWSKKFAVSEKEYCENYKVYKEKIKVLNNKNNTGNQKPIKSTSQKDAPAPTPEPIETPAPTNTPTQRSTPTVDNTSSPDVKPDEEKDPKSAYLV